MRVEFKIPESVIEPRLWMQHEQVVAMVLRPGSIEWGFATFRDAKGRLQRGRFGNRHHRHEGEWVGVMNVPSVNLGISDAALMATHDGISGEVELCPQRKFVGARLRALVEAVNAERAAGFPSRRLFLDPSSRRWP